MHSNSLLIQSFRFLREHKISSVSLSALLVGNYALLDYLQKQNVLDSMCMFKNIFGIPCPSCGMTRSCLALAKFNISDAIYYNPFSLLLMGVTIFVIFNEASQLMFHRKISYRWLDTYKWIYLPILILFMMLNWFWSITKGI